MSLTLRIALQSTLDEAGLDLLHTGINQTTKALTIVGSCGKPLVSINGIMFGSKNPTMKEISYASELFKQFITDYSSDLTDFIAESKELKMLEDSLPTLPMGYTPSGSVISLSLEDGAQKGSVYPDGRLSVTGPRDIVTIQALVTMSQEPVVTEYFTKAREIADRRGDLRKSQQKLTSCDI